MLKTLIATAFALVLGLIVAAMFAPQYFAAVDEEIAWRRIAPAATFASLNDYLRDYGPCLHKREAVAALVEAGQAAGLLSRLDTQRYTGRSGSRLEQITFGSLSPDGGLAVTTGSEEGSVWNIATGQRSVLFHPATYLPSNTERLRFGHTLGQAVFLADGETLATTTPPGVVWLWNARNGERRRMIETGLSGPSGLVAAPAGPVIAFVRDLEAAVTLVEHVLDAGGT